MNVFLGVLGLKVIAVLALSKAAGPALLLLGLAIAVLVTEALRRSAADKTRIVQRVELPPAIVPMRGRANTRRQSFATSRAPPLFDPRSAKDRAGLLRRE